MSNHEGAEEKAGEHLEGLETGAGCTEIWERLSDQRAGTPVSDD